MESASQLNREARAFKAPELRITRDGERPVITGHAAVFNLLSEDLGGFREIIEPGAFDRAIAGKDDVRALVEHDPSKVLGRTKTGTLTLSQDDRGLAVEIDPPRTTIANDLLESIRRGDIDSMSFGFLTIKDKWELREGGSQVRHLISVELLDVSPVSFPAYPNTAVAVRSQQQWNRREWTPDSDTRQRYARVQQRMKQLELADLSPHRSSDHD